MKKNIDGAVYEEKIISFLEQKYNKKFTVIKLYQEFEGNSGMSIRALCSEKEKEEQFTVYCYFDSTIATEKITIDGNEHSIVDSYAEVIYQNLLLEEVNTLGFDDCVIKCKVDFNAEQPLADDVASGMDFCLQKQELDPYVKFYVIAEYSSSTETVQAQIEEVIKRHMPSTGYIYLAFSKEYNKDQVLRLYEENQNDFGNYLTNTDFANRVEFILYNNDIGMNDKEIIRE